MRTFYLLGLVAIAACGDDAATSDARGSCASTADPHDEDGDGVVDACDNCPSTPNPTQLDSTEDKAHAFPDGVGDACDPRPGASGDDLRGFYSFATEAQASAWTGSGWSISDDAVHAAGNATWTTTRAQQGDGYFVMAQVASFAPSTTGSLGFALDGDGVSTGAICKLEATMLSVQEVGGAPSSVVLANPIAAGTPLQLIAWRTISLSGTTRIPEIQCRVIYGGATKDVMLALTDELVTGSHVLSAIDASVDITSITVYTSPGPKNP